MWVLHGSVRDVAITSSETYREDDQVFRKQNFYRLRVHCILKCNCLRGTNPSARRDQGIWKSYNVRLWPWQGKKIKSYLLSRVRRKITKIWTVYRLDRAWSSVLLVSEKGLAVDDVLIVERLFLFCQWILFVLYMYFTDLPMKNRVVMKALKRLLKWTLYQGSKRRKSKNCICSFFNDRRHVQAIK